MKILLNLLLIIGSYTMLFANEDLILTVDIRANDTVAIYASDFNFLGEVFDDYTFPFIATFDQAGQERFRLFTCEMRGINEVEIYLIDAIGIQLSCTATIRVNNQYCGDEYPPYQSTCLAGVTLMNTPSGIIHFNANSLMLDSSYLHAFTLPISISFSPDIADSVIIYTCDQRGANFTDLWITDANGNQDSCQTIVNVIGDFGECFDGARILFCTSNEFGEQVENVSAIAKDTYNNSVLNDKVTCGRIDFPSIDDNEICARKNSNPLNGVTTFDMIQIRQHILGLRQLDSPYKMLAADVNQSGGITTADLIDMRRLILGIDTNFRRNQSWRFIDASYEFPAPANPWLEEFPETIVVDANFWGDHHTDFIAIKVGDVNNSADPTQ